MKIGLFFGSFNPIHVGHLILANYILENAALDQVWFVVSPQNPLKKASELLNEYDRLFLTELATKDNNRFSVSNIEFKLPKPSYTIDTLTYLKELHPDKEFAIIMGSDSYQNLPRWKNSKQIMNHRLLVYQRPNALLAQEQLSPNTHLFNAPLLDISASYIRKTLKEGKSIRYMVPDEVALNIEQYGYYK